MKNQRQCERCIGGKLLRFGEELQCINCGWLAPMPEEVSSYRKVLPKAA